MDRINLKHRKENNTTQEEIQILLSLVLKADENGMIHIYDEEENFHEIKWIFLDREELYIEID